MKDRLSDAAATARQAAESDKELARCAQTARERVAISSSTATGTAGSVQLAVACPRNLTVASDRRWVLQHVYRVLLVNKAQDLGAPR